MLKDPSPQSSRALRVRHPCYHSGYQDTLPLATLFESPCVHSTAPPDLTQNLTVEGTGNPEACSSAIRGLFNFSSCAGRRDCAFDGVYQPPVQGQFYVSTPLQLPAPRLCPGQAGRQAQDRGVPGTVGRGAGVGPRPGRAPPRHSAHRPQAFSGFYHTFHFLNLTSGQPLATANATVWEFCQRPWKLVGGPQDPPPRRLPGLQLH